jgi:hypothetical protein
MMREIRDDLQNRANQLAEPAVTSTDPVPQGRPDARLPAWLEHSMARPAMRDIRDELQERTKILDEQIKSARDQFEGLIAQLKQEHDDRIEDLKAELEAVKLLLGFEQRRLSNAIPPTPPQASRSQSRSALPLVEK